MLLASEPRRRPSINLIDRARASVARKCALISASRDVKISAGRKEPSDKGICFSRRSCSPAICLSVGRAFRARQQRRLPAANDDDLSCCVRPLDEPQTFSSPRVVVVEFHAVEFHCQHSKLSGRGGRRTLPMAARQARHGAENPILAITCRLASLCLDKIAATLQSSTRCVALNLLVPFEQEFPQLLLLLRLSLAKSRRVFS